VGEVFYMVPFSTLLHIRAKIDRANEHIAYIDHLCTEVFQTEQITNTKYDKSLGEITVTCGPEIPVPVQLSILSGEALHQLRSSLDHLIWTLVIKTGNTPTRRNQFPIFLIENEYKTASKQMLAGVSVAAASEIETFQPFHANPPKDHPLSLLNELNNTDKHRTLNLISAACVGYESVVVKGRMPGGTLYPWGTIKASERG